MRTPRASSVVPPGLETLRRSWAGVSSACSASSPAPATVWRASPGRNRLRQTIRDTGAGQGLDEQKDIGRTTARECRHGVHERFVVQPDRFPPTLASNDSAVSLDSRDHVAVRHQGGDSPADGRRRIGHGAHDRDVRPRDAFRTRRASCRRQRKQRAGAGPSASPRDPATSSMTCGLTAKTITAGSRPGGTASATSTPWRLRASPARRRVGLDHKDGMRSHAPVHPARQHGAAHPAASKQQDRRRQRHRSGLTDGIDDRRLHRLLGGLALPDHVLEGRIRTVRIPKW